MGTTRFVFGAAASAVAMDTLTFAAAPDCVMVKVWPVTVMVPVRWLVSVLAATVKLTVSLPVPLTPDVMMIQGALLVAIHVQPPCAVTVTLPVPPLLVTAWLAGAME